MDNGRTSFGAPLGGACNVVPFKRRNVDGLEGLVTVETISALISLSGHSGHVFLDYTIGLPCGCAFCALRAGNAAMFRKETCTHEECTSWVRFKSGVSPFCLLCGTPGNVGYSEHLK